MNNSDLLNLEILPLTKVKATLSEQVKKTQGGRKRVAITSNGFPRAILLSYEDISWSCWAREA
jgi:prevent-host-death family protein